jgi:transcription termination factor NusB
VAQSPATVETGIEVQVPLFIKQDEKIVVDTRDGSYQGPRKLVSARSKARKHTLDLLYESDIRSSDLLELLSLRDVVEEGVDARPIREYTRLLVEGVHLHKRKIDELISTYAQGWDMDRLAAVDRNILRLGIFEILWEDGYR